MVWHFSRQLYVEDDRNMTPALRRRHARLAREAAREAVSSLTLTARRQYRRYRKQHPGEYLGWETWVVHYREVTGGPGIWPDPPNDGMNNISMNP